MKSSKSVLLVILSLFLPLFSSCQNEPSELETLPLEESEERFAPKDYALIFQDDFNFFNSENWSKGLTHDKDASIKMLWNKQTGGRYLLNDHYAGYLLDENVFVEDGALHLENRKEIVQGEDPEGVFEYSTGWMNSLQKINFNGTDKGVYIEIKAKFPEGEKVWPAIWLVDDSEHRSWPPEVDIWEYFGKFFNTKHTDQMYMRFIYGKWNDKQDHSVPIERFQKEFNAAKQWHVYGYQWTRTEMRWYIDGELVHTKTNGVEVPSKNWPNKQMCLIINNGLLSVVEEGSTVFPNALVLDYLKIFRPKN